MTTSTESLLNDLREQELIATEHQSQLEKLAKEYDNPRRLCKALVQSDLLTPYQANQLLKGKAESLRLGSYVLLARLGEGGMGQVFKARHVRLNRIVALKRIREDHMTKPVALKRFLREVRLAAGLSHPNIISIYDAEEEGNACFLIMEYIEGRDLAEIVKEEGPIPWEQALEYIRQTALGLDYAHKNGLIHRDIKPHNLLVSHRHYNAKQNQQAKTSPSLGEVKILDLGVARLLEGDDATQSTTLTREGVVVGTIDYLSPEQARSSHKVDARADLYSLGCTLYHMLTGRTPFPGDSALDKLLKHQTEEAIPVCEVQSDIPAVVGELVSRLMKKELDKRCQSASELAGWINSIFEGKSDTLFPSEIDDSATISDNPSAAENISHTQTIISPSVLLPAPKAKRKKALIAGGVLFLLLIILANLKKKEEEIPPQPNPIPPPKVETPTINESKVALHTWPRDTSAIFDVNLQKLLRAKAVQDRYDEFIRDFFAQTRPIQKHFKDSDFDPNLTIEHIVLTLPKSILPEYWLVYGEFESERLLKGLAKRKKRNKSDHTFVEIPTGVGKDSIYAASLADNVIGFSTQRKPVREVLTRLEKNPTQSSQHEVFQELLKQEPKESTFRFVIHQELLRLFVGMDNGLVNQEARTFIDHLETISGSLVFEEDIGIRLVFTCPNEEVVSNLHVLIKKYVDLFKESGALLASLNENKKALFPLVVLAKRAIIKIEKRQIIVTFSMNRQQWIQETIKLEKDPFGLGS